MAEDTLTDDDLVGMSDDDLMSTAYAPREAPAEQEEEAAAEEEVEDAEAETGDDAPEGDDGDPAADAAGSLDADDDDSPADDGANADLDVEDDAFSGAKPTPKTAEAKPAAATKPAAKAEGTKPGTPAPKAEAPAAAADKPGTDTFDYKAAYERLMGPIKANGKEIKLESPDEAIKLIQQGANYTKKMQALQPNLKLLRMLENQGLLDEAKLTRLIDLEKKNPAAIKQIVKESGIDPLELDNTEDPGYTPGNYRVSDAEITFTSTVEEVASEPGGKDLISTIHKTWDERSKKALWVDPDILRVLTKQRKDGIYGRIVAEVDRRKMLGSVPATASFLETYHQVGLEMEKAGKLAPVSAPASQTPIQKPVVTQPAADTGRKVLERSAPAKKPTSTPLSNSDKARAASATKAAPPKKAGGSDFNPLAVSDEDFEKYAAIGRRL